MTCKSAYFSSKHIVQSLYYSTYITIDLTLLSELFSSALALTKSRQWCRVYKGVCFDTNRARWRGWEQENVENTKRKEQTTIGCMDTSDWRTWACWIELKYRVTNSCIEHLYSSPTNVAYEVNWACDVGSSGEPGWYFSSENDLELTWGGNPAPAGWSRPSSTGSGKPSVPWRSACHTQTDPW